MIVQEKFADSILDKMKSHRYGQDAEIIGRVLDNPKGRVLMRTSIGTTRVVDILTGELLPRIC